jgi:hypothetical protein
LSKRFLAPWKGSAVKPAIYHCVSRVVDRRFVFGDEEREQFRMFMRMQENFSGCRVLSYCVMSNHFHILLEVPPMAEGGLSDAELLRRIGCTNSAAFVATVRQELERAGEVYKSLEDRNLNTEEALALGAGKNGTVLGELGIAAMLRCRVRYFTNGAVIGSKAFVNEAFEATRERFPERRKDGARRMRGSGKAAAGVLWSLRDLRVDA